MLWMAVTSDKYELPIAIADTANELADYLGVTGKAIIQMKAKNQSGRNLGYKIVTIEDEIIEQLSLEDIIEKELLNKNVDKIVNSYFDGKNLHESIKEVKGEMLV